MFLLVSMHRFCIDMSFFLEKLFFSGKSMHRQKSRCIDASIFVSMHRFFFNYDLWFFNAWFKTHYQLARASRTLNKINFKVFKNEHLMTSYHPMHACNGMSMLLFKWRCESSLISSSSSFLSKVAFSNNSLEILQ